MPPAPDGHGSAARRSDDHPLRRRPAPDKIDVRSLTIFPLEPLDRVTPTHEPLAADLDRVDSDLHLVEPGRPERADPLQQRRAFQERCAEIAHLLARTRRFEDRLELYRSAGFTWHELSTAAALYPELMPKLNDEWEWVALTLADNLD